MSSSIAHRFLSGIPATLITFCVLLCLPHQDVDAGELSAILNGKSFHIGAGSEWNEENYGFGLEYELASVSVWKTRFMANSFVDSNDNMSHMIGAGLHRRLWQSPRFHDLYFDLGVNAFFMSRKDVNDRQPFPGVIPSMTFGNRYAGINLSWLPRKAIQATFGSANMDREMSGVAFLQLKLSSRIFSPGH